MRKQIKPPPDPIKIYLQAERFRFADEVLRRDPRMDSVPLYMGYVGIPTIVLSAFASELYLKCLLALEGQNIPATHHLKNIFKRLRGKTQNRLSERWEKYIQTTDDGSRRIHEHADYDASELLKVLTDGSTAFDEIRYGHERPVRATFVIGNLPWVLRNEALEQKPEWKSIGPKVFNEPTFPTR